MSVSLRFTLMVNLNYSSPKNTTKPQTNYRCCVLFIILITHDRVLLCFSKKSVDLTVF